jgi:hypothetical protein
MATKTSLQQTILNTLNQGVPIEPLVAFRVVFGLCMAVGTVRFVWLGWVDHHFVQPDFLFKYFGFEWVQPAPEWLLYSLHILLIISALAVAIGWYFKLFAALQFLIFTYLELLDLSYYLNHYYFVSLAALLLFFTPAHRAYSLDVYRGRVGQTLYIPAWAPFVLKFQIAVVYFFAGIAKINYDWLIEALPLKIWLPAAAHLPILGPVLSHEFTPYLFSWVGMLFDCSIPFLLVNSFTRPYAYMLVVVFHVLTGWLFQIGVFPLVMISGTLIFFSAEFHKRWLRFFANKPTAVLVSSASVLNRWTALLLCGYILFQTLFPLRYLLYPGNMFWTEEGYRFSWRVMLMEKAGTATFYVKDGNTGREGIVLNEEFLNEHQEKQMAMQPDMILQFAHFLAQHYAQLGLQNPQVRAEVYVTLNGRPSRLLFDPNLILNDIKDSWAPKTWLYPPNLK